ncbi:hypothetical protein C9F07_34115, partial [Salmonella enterica subsp. enterica serovar Poona]
MFSEIMRYILDLGPTVMLPLVIIVFSKLLGMKLGDCFKSGFDFCLEGGADMQSRFNWIARLAGEQGLGG